MLKSTYILCTTDDSVEQRNSWESDSCSAIGSFLWNSKVHIRVYYILPHQNHWTHQKSLVDLVLITITPLVSEEVGVVASDLAVYMDASSFSSSSAELLRVENHNWGLLHNSENRASLGYSRYVVNP
jgi:hypothetical protein